MAVRGFNSDHLAVRDRDRGIWELCEVGLWDQVVEEVNGRHIRIGDRWLVDFASCNYLGFDLDPSNQAAIGEQVRRWGTHPSWSRMLGSPRLYPLIEERLVELLGAPDVLVLPTISQIHMSAIPLLAEGGVIFLDSRAHRTIYDGCIHAKVNNARLERFPSGDMQTLSSMLDAAASVSPKLVCVDGVNSMTGNPSDVPGLARLCRRHNALLYIDDAHGFGVLGQREAEETSPYGLRGNSVVCHMNEGYENVILVGGFSKAYSSMLAFVACAPKIKQLLKVSAPTYLFSGPVPTAALATVLAGLDVNAESGEAIRADLWRKTQRVLEHLRHLGVHTPNRSGFPLIEVPLDDPGNLLSTGRILLDRGIYATLAPYPGVPRDEVGFRIQLTAANTDDDIDLLTETLTMLATKGPGAPHTFRTISPA